MFNSKWCNKCKTVLEPIFGKLEVFTGRGGNMTGGLYSQIALTKRGSENDSKKSDSPSKFIDYMNDDDEMVHIESNFEI